MLHPSLVLNNNVTNIAWWKGNEYHLFAKNPLETNDSFFGIF